MITINRNAQKDVTARARILLGHAEWLVTGWMERQADAVGSRRNSPAPQREQAVPCCAHIQSDFGLPFHH